jgi:hypothetical protein
LPEPVQAKVNEGVIKPTAAYEISKLPTDDAIELAEIAVTEGLTFKDVAEAVQVRKHAAHAGLSTPSRVATKRWTHRTKSGVCVTVTGATNAETIRKVLRDAGKVVPDAWPAEE